MSTCGAIFETWSAERECGVFNASATVSKERGPAAYNCMGHGIDGYNFAVIAAAREMLQNERDAGASLLEVWI
jgi:hypothetical protein